MSEAMKGCQPCKENIHPPPVKIQALTLNEEPPNFADVCDASQAAIQQQRQLFESELRSSSGDEALDVWDRYVTWSLQVSTDGQRDGGLQPLLERAVMQFADKSYFNDPRYISLWIRLAQNSPVPADMFRYMEAQEMGRTHAAFYVAWAQHLESQGELQQAESILQEGLSCEAQPLGSIQEYLRCVQVRLPGAGGTVEAGSPPRISQVDLRPRGRKRHAESTGCLGGLNLQLPSVVPRAQSLPLLDAEAPTECSMYCKEQLTQGIEEFCFEELRAQRYALGQRQEVDEKIRQMNTLEEKLKEELQEKQRMLLLLRSQAFPPEKVGEGGAGGQADHAGNRPAAEPFHVFPDPLSGSASAMHHGADGPSPLFNDVFVRPGEKALCVKIQFPCPGGAAASENPHAGKGAGVRPLCLTETVVGGVQNKTLCSSPDNTRDFASSAHLVSTPCLRRAPPSEADNQGVVSEEQWSVPQPPEPKESAKLKLSPIQEASLEALTHTTHSTLWSTSTKDPRTPPTGDGPLLRDPCSGETRKRLLDQAEVSSFPGYHTVGTLFPDVDEDTQLSLGSEVVFLHSMVQEEERFSVFSGLSQGNHVVLKVERSLLPWDFYVVSQLRRRQPPEDSAPLPHACCFLFLDACVTLYTAPRHQSLSEWVGLSQEGGVASVVSSLILMMRTFHSSSLLLGAVHADSLLLIHGDSRDSLLCVDLHPSLDPTLQEDLTSASAVPAALGYIQQGVLKTTDSPYQVDLVCLAEAVHLLLTKRKMILVEEEDGWAVEQPGLSTARNSVWKKLFHLLLNSSGQSSISVLSQLLDLLVVMTPDGRRDSWWLP